MKFSHQFDFKTCFVLFLCLSFTADALGEDDWPRWRGPSGNGIAAEGQIPPVNWSESENVAWVTKVPGRGHSSPIIVGDKIFLTTSVKGTQTQSVLCYDRVTGKEVWKTDVNTGGLPSRIHGKNTHASPTVAVNGNLVFAVFNHHQKTEVIALDFFGKEIWRKEVGAYKPKYPFGFGASPIAYKSMVLVTNENMANGTVTAYDAKSGEVKWKIPRGQTTSYSTPVVAKLGGKDVLLLSGGQKVKAYKPDTGKELWNASTIWEVSCGTMVWSDDLVFASGGYPNPQTVAVNAKTGEKVWTNSVKSYEQSMLAVDGYIYAHSDRGVLYCWKARDGREMWKQRFRFPVSVSPTLVNGNVYFTAENGETIVAKCTPDGFQKVATNRLGDEAFASPAFCGNQMFVRVGKDGQGYLYCIGKK